MKKHNDRILSDIDEDEEEDEENDAEDESYGESVSGHKQKSNLSLNEIIMFSSEFVIKYNHFDALNLTNPHQVTLNASCKDMGVYLIN